MVPDLTELTGWRERTQRAEQLQDCGSVRSLPDVVGDGEGKAFQVRPEG